MNGNYTGNETFRAVKPRAAVLGVADIVRARNSRSNFPTQNSRDLGQNAPLFQGQGIIHLDAKLQSSHYDSIATRNFSMKFVSTSSVELFLDFYGKMTYPTFEDLQEPYM